MVLNDSCFKNSCSGWSCTRAKYLFVMKSNLFSIFITCMFGVLAKKLLHNQRLQRFIPAFFFFCSHKLYFLCIINIFISEIIFCSHLFVFFLLFSLLMLPGVWPICFLFSFLASYAFSHSNKPLNNLLPFTSMLLFHAPSTSTRLLSFVPSGAACFDVAFSSFACCEGIAQLVFRSPSEEILPYKAVDSVCPWEEVSSGSSYVATLNHPPVPMFSFTSFKVLVPTFSA